MNPGHHVHLIHERPYDTCVFCDVITKITRTQPIIRFEYNFNCLNCVHIWQTRWSQGSLTISLGKKSANGQTQSLWKYLQNTNHKSQEAQICRVCSTPTSVSLVVCQMFHQVPFHLVHTHSHPTNQSPPPLNNFFWEPESRGREPKLRFWGKLSWLHDVKSEHGRSRSRVQTKQFTIWFSWYFRSFLLEDFSSSVMLHIPLPLLSYTFLPYSIPRWTIWILA